VQYWDSRYASETEPFEWYYPYPYFRYVYGVFFAVAASMFMCVFVMYREIINEYVARDKSVMVAGCGNSNMLQDMAEVET
jgi:hypothetical protein